MEAFKMIFDVAVGILLIFFGRKIYLENAEYEEDVVMNIVSGVMMLLGFLFIWAIL